MGRYVERDPVSGQIVATFAVQQDPPVEYLEEGSEGYDALLLTEGIAAKLQAIEAIYLERQLVGFPFAGDRFECDDASMGKISGLATDAGFNIMGIAGVEWTPVPFVSVVNVPMLFATPESFIPFATAGKKAVQALFAHRFALKSAVRAATTLAELAAIDETAGWPE